MHYNHVMNGAILHQNDAISANDVIISLIDLTKSTVRKHLYYRGKVLLCWTSHSWMHLSIHFHGWNHTCQCSSMSSTNGSIMSHKCFRIMVKYALQIVPDAIDSNLIHFNTVMFLDMVGNVLKMNATHPSYLHPWWWWQPWKWTWASVRIFFCFQCFYCSGCLHHRVYTC